MLDFGRSQCWNLYDTQPGCWDMFVKGFVDFVSWFIRENYADVEFVCLTEHIKYAIPWNAGISTEYIQSRRYQMSLRQEFPVENSFSSMQSYKASYFCNNYFFVLIAENGNGIVDVFSD